MLTKEELKLFIDEDMASVKKQQALTGARYYDAENDIKNCRLLQTVELSLSGCQSL